MRRTTALLLILGLAVTFAATAEQSISSLKKIESSRFGKTLLDTIQLQLQTNDSVDKLLSELNEMSADITKEQEEDTASIIKLQGECSADFSRLNGDIADAKKTIQDLNDEIAQKSPLNEQKKQLLAEKQDLSKSQNQSLQDRDAHFQTKSEQFEQEQREHNHAQSVIEKAREVIRGTFGVRSFLEVRKPNLASLVQVSQHFADSAKNGQYKRKSWNSFFKVLSQITAAAPVQADAGAIKKINEIIDTLLLKINESLTMESAAYNNFKVDYLAARERLLNDISATNQEIQDLISETTMLSNRLVQAANDLANEEIRLNEKNSELDNRTSFCNLQNNQYNNRTSERTDQVSTVSQVVGLIQSQLRVIKKYVNERE